MGKGLLSSLRALGNRMVNRVKIQLGRIADSIQRLTAGNTFRRGNCPATQVSRKGRSRI